MTVTVSYAISNTVNFTEVTGYEPDDPTVAFPTIIGNANFGFTVSFTIESDGEEEVTLLEVECTSSPDFTNVSNVTDTSVRIQRDTNVVVFPGERFEFVRYGYNGEGDNMHVANSATFPPFPENPNDTSADANTPVANTEFDANTSFDDGGTGIIDLNTSIFPTSNTQYGIFETFSQEQAINSNIDSSVYAWIIPPIPIRDESFTFLITYQEGVSIIVETITISYDQQFQWSWVAGKDRLSELVERSRF